MQKGRGDGYNKEMGNNPVLHSQFDKKEQAPDAVTLRLKAVREEFSAKLYAAQKSHREAINGILRTIDERKIKDLKEKLKNM